jgi:hypothetical protein
MGRSNTSSRKNRSSKQRSSSSSSKFSVTLPPRKAWKFAKQHITNSTRSSERSNNLLVESKYSKTTSSSSSVVKFQSDKKTIRSRDLSNTNTEMDKIVNFQHSQFPLSRKSYAADRISFESYADSRCETTDLEKEEEREELITLSEVILEFSDDTWDKTPSEPNDYTKECFFTNSHHLWDREYSKDLQRFKILDANDLGMTTYLLRTFPKATIYICNPCASLIAQGQEYKNLNRRFPGQIHLFSAYEYEQMFHLADIHHSGWKSVPECTLIWYDTCGAVKDTDLQTMELYFNLNMFPKNRPSVFSATFGHRDGSIYDSISSEIKKKYKIAAGRFAVDDFIQMCARSAGYMAIRPSRLMLPRVKSTPVYTWTYIIVPLTWYAENFKRAQALEQSVNWCLADYRDISGKEEYFTFKKDFFYDGKNIELPK